MNHLSLFTGAGGGDLAHQHLLNFKTIGYVEIDAYCQKIIAQRIKDGFLDEAPIFGDIDDFIESGAAKKYKGYVDVVTAGFPCQPFSVAGKQKIKKGQDDERNKWPQTIQCIRDVGCRIALLDNVAGLLNSGYFPEILRSLAEAGFDARWTVLGADDVGAPHRRKRLWVLAYPISDSERTAHGSAERVGGCEGKDIGEGRPLGSDFGDSGEDVADSNSSNERARQKSEQSSRDSSGKCVGDSSKNQFNRWPTEPQPICRVAHGVAHRLDRLRCLGNGQVPRVVATAWRILND